MFSTAPGIEELGGEGKTREGRGGSKEERRVLAYALTEEVTSSDEMPVLGWRRK